VDSDIGHFVSTREPSWQIRLALALQNGTAGQLVVIAVGADTPRAAERAARALSKELEAAETFSLLYGGDSAQFAGELEKLLPYRYLLSDRIDAAAFSEERLLAGLNEAQSMLGDARAWFVTQLLPRDPTLETLHLLRQLSGPPQTSTPRGALFSRDGRRAVLLGVTRATGSNAEGQRAAAESIELAALAVRAAEQFPGFSVEYTGLGILGAQARDSTQSKVERLGWISGALVFLILYLGYRRALPVFLSLVPVAIGIAAGLVLTAWVYGGVNILTLAFGCILVDEGSDYPSYLLTQARHGEFVSAEAARSWPTLRLAMLTSVAAYVVLTFAQFRGLQQLGLLCTTGLLVAGMAARWLLPDLLGPRYAATWSPPALLHTRVRPKTVLHPAALRATILVVPLACALMVAQRPPIWDDAISSINPLPAKAIAADRALRSDAGLPADQTVLLFRAADLEHLLQAQEALLPVLKRMQDSGLVTTFDLVARYLPSRQVQARRHVAIPDDEVLRSRLIRAVQATDFNLEAFEPFLSEIQQLRLGSLEFGRIPAGILRHRVDSLLMQMDGRWVGLVPITGAADKQDVLNTAQRVANDNAVDFAWFEPGVELVFLTCSSQSRTYF
jgi:predicted exporter